METEVINAAQGGLDFTIVSLVARATLVVKLVMLLLVLASFWAWAIIFQKLIVYRSARRQAAQFDRRFWSGAPLEDFYRQIADRPSGGAQRVFCAGMNEWERSHRDDGGLIDGAQARIERVMDVAIANEGERLGSGLPVLATIGSTSPFVGLFGTVWGIMNAFREIGEQQSTNLAVVAPGIAEALFATALGLLAAIPAVVFFNKLSSDSDRILSKFEAFSDEFVTILSRELDR